MAFDREEFLHVILGELAELTNDSAHMIYLHDTMRETLEQQTAAILPSSLLQTVVSACRHRHLTEESNVHI